MRKLEMSSRNPQKLFKANAKLPEWWCAGRAECLQCNNEWTAVWELGCEPLECPECKSKDTDRTRE